MGVPVLNHAVNQVRVLLQGHLSCFKLALSLVKDRAGLEIGAQVLYFGIGTDRCPFMGI